MTVDKKISDISKNFIETWKSYFYDFSGFSRNILGYKDMNKEHEALCQFIAGPKERLKWQEWNKKKKLFKLILMPRYTFKSCVCTIGYSLWRLMREPNLRILIYSDATQKAQGFLTGIKNHIEGKVPSSVFREKLGPWETDPRKGKWNESQIIIKMRDQAQSEASIETAGIDTSLVGKHYDLIIFDDLVSDKNVTTKEQMDKTEECYQKALSLLKPGGEVLMVGTRWHHGDLYGRIIAENNERQNFGIFHRNSGWSDKEFLFSDIGLTEEFLTNQRREQGNYIFSCIYENQPTDPETAIFKVEGFSFYGAVKPDDLYITGTCDPAGEGEDFTAITVVGTDNNMDMYILDIVNAHLQMSEIVEKIINLNYKYKFKRFGIEDNFYRGALKKELDRRINEERKNGNFKIFKLDVFTASSKRGEGKFNRIRALQPYHERGVLKFPGEKVELLKKPFSDLAYQMLQFPYSAHDDILDSLAYHLNLVQKGGVVKKEELPKFSPAWLEKRQMDKEIEHNNRLPRRFRKRVNQLSLS